MFIKIVKENKLDVVLIVHLVVINNILLNMRVLLKHNVNVE